MRTPKSGTRQERQITCVACASHMHPVTVPWLQHEIGCPVRTAALSRYRQDTSPPAGRLFAASASSRS